MASQYTQEHRLFSFNTVVGPNELLVRSFSGWEAISSPFLFQLELLSENDAVDLDALIGTSATLRIGLADGTPRCWNGHFSRIIQGHRGAVFTSYHAEVVPWLWFLGLRVNSRIFQNKKTPDILREIFNEYPSRNFDLRLDGDFPVREYCVQYRETDLSFVMRLMEEEGIFFFFEHKDGEHKLVLANSPSGHTLCDGQSTVRVRNSSGGRWDEDFIGDLRFERQYVSSGHALADFNFHTPAKNLHTSPNGNAPLEVYDQPGNYGDKARGTALNRIRLEEIQASQMVARGEGNCRAFSAGYRFQLQDHYRQDWNQWYVLTEVRHHGTQAGNFLGDEVGDSGESSFQNDFTAIPYDTPFRPLRRTPVPVVEGCQTAIVVGPSGEEIYTDELGRVKVQFHWDREGQRNEKSSCWIRVGQSWAGKNWGSIAIPRIGQEVIVDFLEGNPDRPIILGSVYNADQMPPYKLPGGANNMGFKSKTVKGGGFNEISINDTDAKEGVVIHAQHDMSTKVLNNDVQSIEQNRQIEVKGTHTETITKDMTLKIAQGSCATTVNKEVQLTSETAHIHLKASTDITLEVGASKLVMKSSGEIELHGVKILSDASGPHTIKGARIDLNP
jgi:type VI secretion system secreted protein VgrG